MRNCDYVTLNIPQVSEKLPNRDCNIFYSRVEMLDRENIDRVLIGDWEKFNFKRIVTDDSSYRE
jgi:hypothetical protein